MSSRFTATRHTRKRPPVCHSSLREPVKLKTPGHPALMVATGGWVDIIHIPVASLSGTFTLNEYVEGAEWSGIIHSTYQSLEIEVLKTPGDTVCEVTISIELFGVKELDSWGGIPCPDDMCNFNSGVLRELIVDQQQYHWAHVRS